MPAPIYMILKVVNMFELMYIWGCLFIMPKFHLNSCLKCRIDEIFDFIGALTKFYYYYGDKILGQHLAN